MLENNMIPNFFITLSEEIIKSWIKKKSNYIIICPPMSNSYLFFRSLTNPSLIKKVLGEDSSKLAIAILDNQDFKNEITFAKKVCQCWGIGESCANTNDATETLNYASSEISNRGKIPVLVIKRFHDALVKLGEDFGSTLRNLEHDYALKTVVELPVGISTLRTRWEQDNRQMTPFLVSDWGQGHTHKLLKGYDKNEIEEILRDKNLHNDMPALFLSMTAGLHGIVDNLLQDLDGKNPRNLNQFCISRAKDLCGGICDWFEGSNSEYYKKAFIDFIDDKEKNKNLSIIRSHDWSDLLVDKRGDLKFNLLSFQIRAVINNKLNASDDLEKIRGFVEKSNFQKVSQLLEYKSNINLQLGDDISYGLELSDLCHELNNIYNNYPNWENIGNKIDSIYLIETHINNILKPDLDCWKNISKLLSKYFVQKGIDPKLRIEQFICESSDIEISDFLLLLQVRINDADKQEPFYALQGIISHPESLLQLYCYKKFGIKFWDFEGIDHSPEEIARFINRSFKMPSKGATLGFAELMFISTFIAVEKNVNNALVDSFEKMESYLRMYELRKDQVHSTAFIKPSDWYEYRDFCSGMVSEVCVSLGFGKLKQLILPKDIFVKYLNHII